MHVLIVGAGIAGLSAAWALVRDGHRVTVVEQGPIPNPRGTSVDAHRLIRRAYGRETGYMRMITHAYAAWDRLWADLGVKLCVDTGALSMSRQTDDWVAASLKALLDAGVTVPLVVTRPDRPVGRHSAPRPSPVAELAASRGIPRARRASGASRTPGWRTG